MCLVRQLSLGLGFLYSLWNSTPVEKENKILSNAQQKSPLTCQDVEHNVNFSDINVSPEDTEIIEDNLYLWGHYKLPDQPNVKEALHPCCTIEKKKEDCDRVDGSFVTHNTLAFWKGNEEELSYWKYNLDKGRRKKLYTLSHPLEDQWVTLSEYDTAGLHVLGSFHGLIKVINRKNAQELLYGPAFTHNKGPVNDLILPPNKSSFIGHSFKAGRVSIVDVLTKENIVFDHPEVSTVKVVEEKALLYSMSKKVIKIWDSRNCLLVQNLKGIEEISNFSITPLPGVLYTFVKGFSQENNKAYFSLVDLRNYKNISLPAIKFGSRDSIENIITHYVPPKNLLFTAVNYDTFMGGTGVSVVKGFLPLGNV